MLRYPERWRAEALLVRWSDRVCEFGEGSRDPQPWGGVGGEFVVAAVDVLDECVPGADGLDGAEAF